MPFREGVVLQMHSVLYRYLPQAGGRWKATNNDILERLPNGSSRLRFQAVAAHLTPMAMGELSRLYASALDQPLAAPYPWRCSTSCASIPSRTATAACRVC